MSKARDLANAGTALGAVTATELGYVDGVTSAIQTQLNAKQAVVSGVDDTEIGYLNGVTSAIQTQIDSKIGSASAINPTIVDAKGDIIAATAADTVARLAVGANDTVLTADSTAATGLKWSAPAAGGMTLISTTTLTGASITISSIPQTYNTLYVVMRNTLPANAGADIAFRFNADGTASRHAKLTSLGGSLQTFTLSSIALSENTDNGVTQSMFVLTFPDYTNTTTWKNADVFGYGNDDTTTTSMRQVWNKAAYNQTVAITSLSFFPTTGNFTSGSVLLYGVK